MMRPTVIEYIPAIGVNPMTHPDQYDMQQAPASLNAPDGHPTVNYDRPRKTICIKFYQTAVSPELIRRAINQIVNEVGPANIVAVEIFVSDAVMATDGALLLSGGYDRVLEANSKSGLYRFRKAVRLKKVEKEEQ